MGSLACDLALQRLLRVVVHLDDAALALLAGELAVVVEEEADVLAAPLVAARVVHGHARVAPGVGVFTNSYGKNNVCNQQKKDRQNNKSNIVVAKQK